jgi:methylmalonyl-CoA/ethylmalonyl-CoA epimerase
MFDRYKLHHVGVVSSSFQEAEGLMATLGLREEYRGFVATWSCWCIFTQPASGTSIELVVPEGGAIARFNKGLGGVHHFALEVESLAEATRWAAERGMRMIEPQPVKGAGNFWCNFLSPASTRGVQIEFVELI